jgi:hypothetical protein
MPAGQSEKRDSGVPKSKLKEVFRPGEASDTQFKSSRNSGKCVKLTVVTSNAVYDVNNISARPSTAVGYRSITLNGHKVLQTKQPDGLTRSHMVAKETATAFRFMGGYVSEYQWDNGGGGEARMTFEGKDQWEILNPDREFTAGPTPPPKPDLSSQATDAAIQKEAGTDYSAPSK